MKKLKYKSVKGFFFVNKKGSEDEVTIDKLSMIIGTCIRILKEYLKKSITIPANIVRITNLSAAVIIW